MNTPSPLDPMRDSWITKKEVCFFLHASPKTIERMVKKGQLNAYLVGSRSVRFNPNEVKKLPKVKPAGHLPGTIPAKF